MTGYGKSEATVGNKKITVEVRSLNSKQLDLSMRLPALYRPFEYEIRSRVGKAVVRGKVDVFVNVEATSAAQPVAVNRELFKSYYETLRSLGEE